jgi:hypothetical protein
MDLFAAFITTEQLLASALVGGSAVLVYNGIVQIRKNLNTRAARSEPTTDLDEADEPGESTSDAKEPAKPLPMPAAVAMLVVGVALLIIGILWRIDAER